MVYNHLFKYFFLILKNTMYNLVLLKIRVMNLFFIKVENWSFSYFFLNVREKHYKMILKVHSN